MKGRQMTVEYFGMPGSGKTYAMEREYAQAQGEKRNMTAYMLETFRGKVLRKCACYLPCLSGVSGAVYRRIRACCGGLDARRRRELLADLCVKYSLMQKYHTMQCFYDEGIVQAVVSYGYWLGYDFAAIERILDVFDFGQTAFRYVARDISTCLQNQKRRNRHVCEMDEWADERLENYMQYTDEMFKRCADYLRNKHYAIEVIE